MPNGTLFEPTSVSLISSGAAALQHRHSRPAEKRNVGERPTLPISCDRSHGTNLRDSDTDMGTERLLADPQLPYSRSAGRSQQLSDLVAKNAAELAECANSRVVGDPEVNRRRPIRWRSRPGNLSPYQRPMPHPVRPTYAEIWCQRRYPNPQTG